MRSFIKKNSTNSSIYQTIRNEVLADIDSNSGGFDPNLPESLTNKDLTSSTNAFPSNLATLNSAQTFSSVKTFSASPVISSITNGSATLVLPNIINGTVALLSDIPSLANYATLNTAQSFSGIKTFSASPVISSITNVGTLILPTSSGTLALLSDIPSLTNYATLNTAQTFSSVKTFSASPVISSITNGSATLVLPNIINGTVALLSDIPSLANYVTLSGAETISGAKTFSSNITLSSTRILSAALGTALLPVYTIGVANNDGIYSPSAGNIGITTAGSLKLTIGTNITAAVGVILGNGTAAIPAIRMSDTTTGVFRPTTNTIGFSASGVQVMQIGPAKVNIVAGTLASPSLCLGVDTTSGFYQTAANTVSLAISGVNVFTSSSIEHLFNSKVRFVTTSGISGGEALRITSFASAFQTRLYSVNATFNTDLYFPEVNGIDNLISRSSVDTLSNKTMQTLKVGSSGTVFSQMTAGSFTLTNPNLTPAGATTQVITHNLGAVPSGMVACIAQTGGPGTALNFLLCSVLNMTTTQATVNISNIHPSATTIGSPTIAWKAWL